MGKPRLKTRNTHSGTENPDQKVLQLSRGLDQYAILELLPSAVIVTMTDGGIVFANPRAQEQFGIATGKNIRDYFSGADAEPDFFAEMAREGWINEREIRFQTPGGASGWGLVASRILDGDGEPSIISTITDITEQKEAEVRVTQEHENFRRLFSAAPAGLLLLDSDTVITDASKAVADMVLREPADMIATRAGGGLLCVHSTESPKGCGFGHSCGVCPLRRGIEGVLADGTSVHGAEIPVDLLISGSPQQRWLRINAEPVELNGKKHVILAVDDITEKKRFDRVLYESERRYHVLFTHNHDAIFILDFEGRHIDANPRAEEMLGYSHEEILQLSVRETSAELPKSQDIMRRLLEGEDIPNYERLFRKKDGRTFPVEIKVDLIRGVDNEPLYIQSTVKDITERKKIEQQTVKDLERSKLLLELYEKSSQLSDKELYDFVLDRAVQLTDSAIGFLHLVSENQQDIILTTWNSEALLNCSATYDTHYPIGEAGIWVDCVRYRKPVIYNDYPNEPSRRGLPDGHAPLSRFMSIPVVSDDRVHIIFGVGNKVEPYNEGEVVQIQLIANELYKVIEQRKLQKELQSSQERFSKAFYESPLPMSISRLETGELLDVNTALLDLIGFSREEMIGRTTEELGVWVFDGGREKLVTQMRLDGYVYDAEVKFRAKDGGIIITHLSSELIMIDQQPCVINTIVDVTSQKQADLNLRESEARYRLIAENTGDVIWVLDVETRHFKYVSPSISRLLGYSSEEILLMELNELLTPQAAQEVAELIQARVAAFNSGAYGENAYSDEIDQVHKNGAIVHTEVTTTLVFNDEGKLEIVGSTRNITERKQVEAALREREETYRTLVNAIPDLVIRFDHDLRHLYVSDNISEVVDLTPESFIGKTHRELDFPEEMCEAWEQHIRKVFETGQPVFTEFVFSGKSGRAIFDWRLYPEFDGGSQVESVLSISRDITAQRKVEENYRTLFRQMLDGFALHEIICDENGKPVDYRFLAVNPAFESLTGLSADDLIGQTVMTVMPGTEQHWIDAYGRVALTGEPAFFDNYAREIGKYFSVTAFQYAPGQFGTIFIDITERKQYEEALARQAERLNILHTMENIITSNLDMRSILDLLVWIVVDKLHMDAATVLLYNPEENALQFASKEGFHTAALEETHLSLGNGLAGQAAQLRKTVYISDLTTSQDYPILMRSLAEEKFVTYIAIPLLAKGRLMGVLEIFHRSVLKPSPEWVEFLETLANQAAMSIDNANLLQTTQQGLKETNALYRINQYLISTIDHESLMTNVVELLQSNFGYYYVQIFVVDPRSGDFVMRAGSGEIGQKLKAESYRLAAGDGIVGFTAETGKPFFTNDVEHVISHVRMPYLSDTVAELAMPIRAGDQILGLLDIHQDRSWKLTARDEQIVSTVADQLAVALQKAKLYADLQEALRQEKATRSQLIHTEKLILAGRLLASVSHELNNPIQAIQNALFLLQEEKGISLQGKQDLSIVLSETERMASLLERLRATYQPVSKEEFVPVQFNDLVEDTCALLATHLRHHGISYAYHPDPSLPFIPGLSGHLRQVILNLMMNAVDAMPSGGHMRLSTQYLPDEREVLFTVSDTGTGIDPEIYANIFDAFVTSKERGTGLGLTISYEIILKHHGRIEAKNNPNHGATFSVWLPVEYRGES